MPAAAHVLMGLRPKAKLIRTAGAIALTVFGFAIAIWLHTLGGLVVILFGAFYIAKPLLPALAVRGLQLSHAPIFWISGQ